MTMMTERCTGEEAWQSVLLCPEHGSEGQVVDFRSGAVVCEECGLTRAALVVDSALAVQRQFFGALRSRLQSLGLAHQGDALEAAARSLMGFPRLREAAYHYFLSHPGTRELASFWLYCLSVLGAATDGEVLCLFP
jgi:hypothetical protein